MTEEMVDVVDENDKVIDTVPRSEMRKKNLKHRSVFFMVLKALVRISSYLFPSFPTTSSTFSGIGSLKIWAFFFGWFRTKRREIVRISR